MGSLILLQRGASGICRCFVNLKKQIFRFYFGVGGGTSEFISCVQDCVSVEELSGTKHRLKVTIDAAYEDGSSNIREILKIVKEEII